MEDKRSETGWLSSRAIKTLQQAGGCGEKIYSGYISEIQ
jgi:hypothetical protein